jgi:hypothetical protein
MLAALRHARATAAVGALLALLVAGGCGGGGKSTSTRTAATTAPARVPLTAVLRTGGPHPKVNVDWPITIRVSAGGRPLRASVRYQFLLGGRVVARRSHYTFTGTFHDTITWPASAVGIPLVFRAVVTTSRGRRNLDYPVKVVR